MAALRSGWDRVPPSSPGHLDELSTNLSTTVQSKESPPREGATRARWLWRIHRCEGTEKRKVAISHGHCPWGVLKS